MHSPSEAIANMLAKNGVVTEDDKSLYIYGLHQLGVTMLNVATTVVIGIVMGMLWQSLFFLFAYIPIRRFSGGYHARTELRCYVASSLLVCAGLLVIRVVPANLFILFPLAALSGAVIFVLAPVDSANKPLDTTEYRVYRRRSRYILAVHWGVLLIAAVLSAFRIFSIVMVADMTLGVLLLFGWMKNQSEEHTANK